MDQQEWNQIIRQFPMPSLLQTWEWGQVKTRFGWEMDTKTWEDEKGETQAAAVILRRAQKLPVIGKKIKVLYIPKGPLLKDWGHPIRKRVFQDLLDYSREENAVYLKIDPEVIISHGYAGNPDYDENPHSKAIIQELQQSGWLLSGQQIQFKNTFWIDLKPSEKELLAGMKQKTRYNIRLAEKKGVRIRQAGLADLERIYKMYTETGHRDGFIIRPKDYYLYLWETFMQAGMATPLLAEVEGEPVAGLFLFHFGNRSWYIYGMSSNLHREKRPNYLLQWEAIRLSKAHGCQIYDLWGAPDVFEESDRLWGVYRFKEGLGGQVVQTAGALDYPLKRFEYKIIQDVLPRLLAFTRGIRRRQIQNELSG